MQSQRYLTTEAKRVELERWKQLKNAMPHDNGPGDKGLPDPEMFEWCDKLNALSGVCTLQSCAGHKRNYNGEEVVSDGHLWLWYDEVMADRFRSKAFELSSNPLILPRGLTVIYSKWGQEVVEIRFKGNGRGCLSESMEVVVGFHQRLLENPTGEC